MSRTPRHDIDENEVEVHDQKHAAAGVTAVAVSMKRALEQMGPVNTARTLLKLNQKDGFDCMSCAWPDPDHRHTAEFCENGAKAVAEEATKARVGADFFAKHSLADLEERTDYWLGKQGRIVGPMVLREGGTHYEPISWDDAFALVGERLRGPRPPGPGRVLHLGPRLQRGRVRLPAVRPRLRHEQHARLLEHVPRVHVRRPGRGDRDRQGERHLPGRAGREADRDHGPEPGHQPPADADRAGAGEAQRRADPGRQPAPRGRADPLQEPPDPARRQRCRHRAGGPAPAGPDQRRPRADAGDRLPARSSGAASTTTSSTGTRPASSSGPSTSAASTGPRWRRPPGCPARRSPRPRRCSGTPTRPSSAGRWASPSTATPSRRSRRSATSRSCRATSASPEPACSPCAATPTCRATARWASGSGHPPTSWTRSRRSSASTRPGSTATTRSSRSGGSGTATRGCSSRWAATSWPRAPTPTSPRRRCAAPT